MRFKYHKRPFIMILLFGWTLGLGIPYFELLWKWSIDYPNKLVLLVLGAVAYIVISIWLYAAFRNSESPDLEDGDVIRIRFRDLLELFTKALVLSILVLILLVATILLFYFMVVDPEFLVLKIVLYACVMIVDIWVLDSLTKTWFVLGWRHKVRFSTYEDILMAAEKMSVYTMMSSEGELVDSLIVDGSTVESEWPGQNLHEVLDQILKDGWRRDNQAPTRTGLLTSYTFVREENLLKI